MTGSNHHAAVRGMDQAGGCLELEQWLPALVEGSLAGGLTLHLMQHVRNCGACSTLTQQFRRFLVEESQLTEASLATTVAPTTQPTSAPFWNTWRERLNQWLDNLFPEMALQPVYRGGESAPRAQERQWEQAARQQAELPIITARQDDLSLILHVARGYVLGHVSDANGDACYPVVLRLAGVHGDQAVVNQPDGTFQLRWDPEASGLECQTPTGVITRFALPD